MADQQKLIRWILDNANKLDLKLKQLTWIDVFEREAYDLEASLRVGNLSFVGRGAASDSDSAICKSVCEAIERFFCFENKISSTGIAGHFDPELAKTNAKLELIERMALSLHVKNKIPFDCLKTEMIEVQLENKHFVNMNLHTLKMLSPNGITAIFCLCEGVTTEVGLGGILGLGCDYDEATAVKKAKIECLRNVKALKNSHIEPISKTDFDKLEKVSAKNRQQLLFEKSYCYHIIESLIHTEKISLKSSFDFPQLKLIFKQLTAPAAELLNCPLQFFQCKETTGLLFSEAEFVG